MDRELLEMALVGYEQKSANLNAVIAHCRAMLRGETGEPAKQQVIYTYPPIDQEYMKRFDAIPSAAIKDTMHKALTFKGGILTVADKPKRHFSAATRAKMSRSQRRRQARVRRRQAA